MRQRLGQRLAELRGELDRGRRLLAELEARGELLRDSVARIAGAVQVLEELAGEGETAPRRRRSRLGPTVERPTTNAGAEDSARGLREPMERRSCP